MQCCFGGWVGLIILLGCWRILANIEPACTAVGWRRVICMSEKKIIQCRFYLSLSVLKHPSPSPILLSSRHLLHSMDIFAGVYVCTVNGMFALLLFAQHTGIHTTDRFAYVNWGSLFRLTPLGSPPPCCSLHPVLHAQLPLSAYQGLKWSASVLPVSDLFRRILYHPSIGIYL